MRKVLISNAVLGVSCLLVILTLGALSSAEFRQVAYVRLSMLFQYEEIQSPDDLVVLHLQQMYSYLPIVPPGIDEMVHPYGSSVVPFQPENFPKAFQSQLVGEWNNSRTAPAYKLWLHIQKRNLIAYNVDGLEIARFPLPGDYDPRWLFNERYPNGFPESFDKSMRKNLRQSLNPSVIVTEITLVPSQYLYAWLLEEEQNALVAQSRMASQSLFGGGGTMMSMMSGTNAFAITDYLQVTNGLQLEFPGATSCYYKVQSSSDLPLEQWDTAEMLLGTTGTMSWVHVYSGSEPDFFSYRVREIAKSLSGDEDEDKIDDVWELSFALDPLDASDAIDDDDSDGLTNYQEYEGGTPPNLSDSNTNNLVDGWDLYDGTLPRGDINGDGMVTSSDLTVMDDLLLDLASNINPVIFSQADLNQDGILNQVDREGLVNLIAGKPILFVLHPTMK